VDLWRAVTGELRSQVLADDPQDVRAGTLSVLGGCGACQTPEEQEESEPARGGHGVRAYVLCLGFKSVAVDAEHVKVGPTCHVLPPQELSGVLKIVVEVMNRVAASIEEVVHPISMSRTGLQTFFLSLNINIYE